MHWISSCVIHTDAQSAGGAVLVSGAKGKPPPNNYKVSVHVHVVQSAYIHCTRVYLFSADCECSMQVSATYADGYRSIAVCPVVGPLAVEKAQKVSEAILSRSVAQQFCVFIYEEIRDNLIAVLRTRGIFKYLGLPDYTQTHVHVSLYNDYSHYSTSYHQFCHPYLHHWYAYTNLYR